MCPQPRKRFAQHWLRSDKALNQIIAAAALNFDDKVLEIGPGKGVLTRRLLQEAQGVVAVELDRDLCEKLQKTFRNADNFLLLSGDFLNLDLDAHLTHFPRFEHPNKVVANIPYNITGPILEKLLGRISQPTQPAYESIVLLVQKEIADRVVAAPGSKIFGALSVRMQYLANCELICKVPAKAFYPAPKVESAVIRLTPRQQPESFTAINPQRLETLVKLGFANKRKMLRNNLKSIIENDELTIVLEHLEINPQSRAEDLSVQEWVNLSNRIESQLSSTTPS